MRFGKISLVLALGGMLGAACVPVARAQKNKKEKVPQTAAAPGAYTKQEIEAEFIEALQEKLVGNTKISLTLFGAFIKKYPDIAAGHFEFAELSSLNGIYSQAMPAYRRAMEIDPQNKWYAVRLAELYDFLKMYKESKEIYRKLADQYPAELEFALSAVSILEQEGKLAEALAMLDKIETQIGVTPDINLEKYRLYMALKKFPEALKELEKLQALYPGEVLYLGMAAEVYHARGDRKKALETYEKILQTDSNNTLIQLAIADYYQKEKDWDKAFYHLEKAFTNPDVEIDKKVMILLSFLEQSNTSEAYRKEAEKLSRLLTDAHPQNPKSWSMAGDICLEQKNWRGALEAFTRCTELDPSKFIFFRQCAQLAIRVEDYAALKKVSETAEELFPLQPEVYLYKGLYLMQSGSASDAAEALNYGRGLVIENAVLQSDFMAALGRLHARQKDTGKAYELLDKAVASAPGNYWAFLQYARVLSENGQAEKARAMADKSIALAGNYPEAYGIKAALLQQAGDLPGASDSIEKAIRNGGNQIKSVLLLYADITEKNGNPSKAAQIRAEANAI